MSISHLRSLGLGSALAVVAAVGLLTLSSSPAAAQVSDWTDATGDLWQQGDWDGDSVIEDNEWRLLPESVTHGDIRWVIAEHRLRNVVVTAKFVDLDPATGWEFYTPLLTNERYYDVSASPTDAKPSGAEVVIINDRTEREVPECGASARVDYASNTVRYRIPRRCISRPRWVRTDAYTFMPDSIIDSSQGPHQHSGDDRWATPRLNKWFGYRSA